MPEPETCVAIKIEIDHVMHTHCHCHGAVASQTIEEVGFNSSKSIHRAVLDDSIERVKALLITRPERICEVDSAGYEPILYAKSISMITLLLGYGANLAAKTREGHRGMLHRAAISGNTPFIEFLLSRGLEDSMDADGLRAIDLARKQGYDEIIGLLS